MSDPAVPMSSNLQHLPVLILSPHSRCNCRCVMCDIWKRTSHDQITASDVARLMPDIDRLGVEWVVLSGGEPLMHSGMFDICQLLRSNSIRVTLLSTGLLLGRYAQQVTENIDDVIVSLDGPPHAHDAIRGTRGAFSALEHGVSKVRQINARFRIAARCTVQQLNHADLVETVECAQNLGLESISFLAADVTSEAFNRPNGWTILKQQQVALTIDQIAVLEKQFEEIASRWRETGFVLESEDKLRRIVRHFRAHLEGCAPQSPRCNAPWVSAVIEADGGIRPCFFHPPVGSIKQLGLLSVLNGPEAVRFRQSLDVDSNPICNRCVCSLNWKG